MDLLFLPMHKLLVIAGPTATGKTSLGIKIAQEFDGEIVSADSRQIYRGLNIGTGKDLPKNLKLTFHTRCARTHRVCGRRIGYYLIEGVKIWLYDVIEPNQRFSAGEYSYLARAVVEDIWKRGKMPVVVGGTGFYIKALDRKVVV